MRRWLFVILLIVAGQLFAQEPTVRSREYLQKKFKTGDYPTQIDFYDWMASYVHKTEDKTLLNGDTPFDGNRQITTEGLPSVTPGGATVTEFLNNLFYAARKPIVSAAIEPAMMERMSAGADVTATIKYTISRPVGCPPITSVTVNGTTATIPNIADGGSGSASITLPTPRNINTAYTVTVTAGNLTVTASATTSWRYARYWGALPQITNITDADILSLTGVGVGTGKELNETRQKTYNGIDGAGKYLVFAFPSNAGTPIFFINGLNSTAFTKVRDGAFINAQGATYNVQVWVSNTMYNSPVAQFEIR